MVVGGSNSLGRLELFQFLEAIMDKMPTTGVFFAQNFSSYLSQARFVKCCLPLAKGTQT